MFGLIQESACCSISSSPEDALEMARQALASRRLSFEEDESCSVLSMAGFPFKDCIVLAVETENPKMDFLHSMEQMTKAYGGGEMDWGFMEELLTWFLRINNMKYQNFIVDAFVDLCLRGVQTVESLATEVPVETVEPLDTEVPSEALKPLANEVPDEIVHVSEEILKELDGLDADCGTSVHVAELPAGPFSMSKRGKHFNFKEESCRIM
ncbi:transcription repressor OFP13-like [Lycium ferocissimum]|uniref:transcription repressor OFP13-like n=1 Tax=Lycium ferocissimum TaxID=112874 RepID=UPI002814DBC5|nr:transcription repressor OFP13-like [Lycium ferocissimum]